MQMKTCSKCNSENPVAKKQCKCGFVFKKKKLLGFHETPVVLTPERLRNVGRPVRSKPKVKQNDFVYENYKAKIKQSKKESVTTIVNNKKTDNTRTKVIPEKLYPKRQRSVIYKYNEQKRRGRKPASEILGSDDNYIDKLPDKNDECLPSSNVSDKLATSSKKAHHSDEDVAISSSDAVSDTANASNNEMTKARSNNVISNIDLEVTQKPNLLDGNDNKELESVIDINSINEVKSSNAKTSKSSIGSTFVFPDTENVCEHKSNNKNNFLPNIKSDKPVDKKSFVSFENIPDSKSSITNLIDSSGLKSPVLISEEIRVLFVKSPIVSVRKLPVTPIDNSSVEKKMKASGDEIVKIDIPDCVKNFLVGRRKRNSYLKSLNKTNNCPNKETEIPKRKYKKRNADEPPKVKRPVGRPRIHFKQNIPKRPVGRPRKTPQSLNITPTHKLFDNKTIKKERFSKIAAAQSVMECVGGDMSSSMTDTTDSDLDLKRRKVLKMKSQTPNKLLDKRRCFLSPPSLIASAKKDRIRNEMLQMVEQQKLARKLERVKPLIIPEEKKEIFGLILEEINRRIQSQSFVVS